MTFPLAHGRADADERRQANRAVAVTVIGLGAARAGWTGRTLQVEIEGWVDPELPAKDADAMGRLVADQLSRQLTEAGSFTWTTRAAPAC